MSIRSRTPGVASDIPFISKQRGPAYSMKTMGNKAMPLHKGAKPGSKGFGENIATEIRAGKPPKQAQAIAYSESGEHRKSHKSHSSHHRHKEHR
jgi:hypothetical protein